MQKDSQSRTRQNCFHDPYSQIGIYHRTPNGDCTGFRISDQLGYRFNARNQTSNIDESLSTQQ